MRKYSASLFNFLFNSVNSIVIIFNGIIMVPVYFKYMSLATYGSWLATGNLVAMLGLVESGFATVITQKMSVALSNKDNKKFKKLAAANIYTAVILASILLILGLLLAPFIANWVNAEADIKNSITIAYVISLASAALSILVSLYGAFPQVWQETKTIGIINTVANLISIISLILYLYFGFGVISLALGYLTRSILNFLGQGFWIFLKWRKLGLSIPIFDFIAIVDLLKACFYPFLSRLSSLIMGNSQSFIIAVFITPSLAAVYDITSKIASVACNFVGMVNGSFFGLFSLTFAAKKKEDINNLIKNISTLFVILLYSVLLYAFVFTEPFVKFWVGLDKFGGEVLLLVIVASLLITHLKKYLNNLLYTGGLINESSKLDMMSMIVYLILLLSIIKNTGIYAVPLAILFSGILFIVFYLKMLKKRLFVDIDFFNKLNFRLLISIAPFAIMHYLLKIKITTIEDLVLYFLAFTFLYLFFIYVTNKRVVSELILKLRNGK